MGQKTREEVHHRPGHTRHFDQQSEEDEEGHGERDENSLFDASHDHDDRRLGGEGLIAEGGKPEGERDRHANEDETSYDADEEDQNVEVADSPELAEADRAHRRSRR